MIDSPLRRILISLIEKIENKLETWKQNKSISDDDYKEMKEELDRFICESGLQHFCLQCGKRILISHQAQKYCSECGTRTNAVRRCRRNKL